MADVSDSLAKSNIAGTILQANKALTDFSVVIKKIEKGEGSMGLLINDKQLYTNLSNASRNLELLLADIKNTPGNYLKFHVSLFKSKEKVASPAKP